MHSRSGLNLTRTRAYSANLGRFISRDPIAERGGVNLYGYVRNNSIRFRDPSGLFQSDPKGGQACPTGPGLTEFRWDPKEPPLPPQKPIVPEPPGIGFIDPGWSYWGPPEYRPDLLVPDPSNQVPNGYPNDHQPFYRVPPYYRPDIGPAPFNLDPFRYDPYTHDGFNEINLDKIDLTKGLYVT